MPAPAPAWLAPEPGRRGLTSASRRAVLRAGLGVAGLAGAGVLGGCGLRLEDDAPAVPFIPRRSIPDEALLIRTHHEVRDLAATAAAAGGSALAGLLAAQHQRQAQVLRSVLTTGGVPSSVIDAPATSAPVSSASGSAAASATASATGSQAVTPAALAEAEARALTPDALAGLATAEAQRPLLAAISAHRAAAAALLGGPVAWPAGVFLPADAATPLLEPTRQAVYATQVAAARLPGGARGPYLDLLGVLQRREAALGAAVAAAAGQAPVGYRLPFPVTGPDDARRLVGTVLDALVARGLDPLAVVPAGSAAVTDVVRLQAEAATLRHTWGAALPPFPGLVDG